jgi:hypothetical protein
MQIQRKIFAKNTFDQFDNQSSNESNIPEYTAKYPTTHKNKLF